MNKHLGGSLWLHVEEFEGKFGREFVLRTKEQKIHLTPIAVSALIDAVFRHARAYPSNKRLNSYLSDVDTTRLQ